MSFNIGHVTNGTNAGWRKVIQPTVWVCHCGTASTKYAAECCGERRPGGLNG